MALLGYNIIQVGDMGAMESKVMAAAADGFVPHGSVTYDNGTYTQVMVKGDVAGGALPTTELDASAINVEAGTDGLAAGTAQEALQGAYTTLAEPTVAADVGVEAGTDGLAAGTVQEALQALATRVFALENP